MGLSAQQDGANKVAGPGIGASSGAAIQGQCNMADAARRERYWHELSDAERIERMHEVVRGLMGTVERQRDELAMLRHHQHSPGGELTVPVQWARADDRPQGYGRVNRASSEGVYF